MSYPRIPEIAATAPGTKKADEEVLEYLDDMASRKEFARFRVLPTRSDVLERLGFRLHGEQRFVSQYQSPYTQVPRLFVNWQTGTGKTLVAIDLAENFLRRSATGKETKVFVVGFTKEIFIDQLLSRSEYRYVSTDEILEISRLRREVARGTVEMRHLASYMGALRRRITDVNRGGRYRFYGYKEFANRLFSPTRIGLTKEFNIQNIYTRAATMDEVRGQLAEAIKSGYVEVDTELLDSMKMSMLIVDEIHNAYNIKEKNAYGVAIQYVLDELDEEAPRSVLLSATPMTGSATEIVDLLNFLVPRGVIEKGEMSYPLKRSDFFDVRDKTTKILPGALEKIAHLSAGRVSFLLDTNVRSYPERRFVGTEVKGVPYLRFTLCEMSAYQERSVELAMGGELSVPSEMYSVYDMAYPVPGLKSHGLHKAEDIFYQLERADDRWLQSNGVALKNSGDSRTITGSFLALPLLKKFSAKYAKMAEDLRRFIREEKGKILVFHDRVHLSGVLQIEEVLKSNGFVDEFSPPNAETICSVCGATRDKHETKKGGHAFAPARFVAVNYSVDKSSIRQAIEKFNSPSNTDGTLFRVLVGSRIIREGFDFKGVRLEMVMGHPADISTLIQIFGRVNRSGSHSMLPPEERNVKIMIYVTVKAREKNRGKSFEIANYRSKMKEYLVIQRVNRAIWRYAVDAPTNYLKIKQVVRGVPVLESLPYSPALLRPTRKERTSTFYAYDYSVDEVKTMMMVIWQMFSERPVWRYDELLAAVKGSHKTHGVDEKTSLFTDENFAAALEQVMERRGEHVVVRVDPYYVKVPIDPQGQPVIDIEVFVRGKPDLSVRKMSVNSYVQEKSMSQVFALRLGELEKRLVDGMLVENAFLEFDEEFHSSLMRLFVEHRWGSSNVLGGLPKSSRVFELTRLYESFKMFLTTRDMAGVRGFQPTEGGIDPLGYFDRLSAHVYDGSAWTEISKASIPSIGERYEENDVVVGFIDKKKGAPKFKIRKPMGEIFAKKSTMSDTRTVDRGVSCDTAPRVVLSTFLEKVVGERDPDLGGESACEVMFRELLKKERAERNKKSGMRTGTRWVYMFNDQLPSVNTMHALVGRAKAE